MTGYDLLKLLTDQSQESLQQEILFEFEVHTAPDRVYSSQVPIVQPLIVDADRQLYPDCGFITPAQAVEHYNRIKQEIAAGEYSWEDLPGGEEMYHPMQYPIILHKDQLLMKLAPTKSYNDEPITLADKMHDVVDQFDDNATGFEQGGIPHLRLERD